MDAPNYKKHFLKRVILDNEYAVKDLYFAQLDNSQLLANYKGLLYRNGAVTRFSQKRVGAIGGSSRVGQAAQAAGSTVLPGNISPLRSPVRSGVARALTPGKPRLRRRVGVPNVDEGIYRCSEGFQFGGRFTDENYSTCGKQLFDIPSLRETLGQALFRTRQRRRPSAVAREGRAVLTPVEGEEQDTEDLSLMIRRAARVPEVGETNLQRREEGIRLAVAAAQNQDSDSGVLIRKDGYAMIPVVSDEELRKVADNKNMEEAAFVKSVRSQDQLGSEELGFLSNTGITTLVYVTPNGATFRVDRTRELSTGERRQLGKDVNSAKDIDVSTNPLARLEFIIGETDGSFELTKDFGDINNPEDPSKEKDSDGLPVWAYGAFIDAPPARAEEAADLTEDEETPAPAATPRAEGSAAVAAPAAGSGADAQEATRSDADVAVAPRSPEDRISSLKEAVEHLNDGGMLSDIDPTIVLQALKRSNAYTQRQPRRDITIFSSEENGKVIVKERNVQFEHLGAHLSSEILRELGVQAPAVRFAGEGDDRPFFYRSPDGVVEDADVREDFEVASVPPERIIATQFADWLTDTRDRTDASLFAVTSNDETDLVVGVGPLSALAGLTQEELEERRSVVLDDFISEANSRYGLSFQDNDEEQKQMMLRFVDQLIERASEFSWEDYIARLKADGVLSEIEETHLSVVQGIYEQRLEVLNNSKETLRQIYGLS